MQPYFVPRDKVSNFFWSFFLENLSRYRTQMQEFVDIWEKDISHCKKPLQGY